MWQELTRTILFNPRNYLMVEISTSICKERNGRLGEEKWLAQGQTAGYAQLF